MKIPNKLFVILTILVTLLFGISAFVIAATNPAHNFDSAFHNGKISLTTAAHKGKNDALSALGQPQVKETINLETQGYIGGVITDNRSATLANAYDLIDAGASSGLTAAIVQTDPFLKGNTMASGQFTGKYANSVSTIDINYGGEALASYIVSGLSPIMINKEIGTAITANYSESKTGGGVFTHRIVFIEEDDDAIKIAAKSIPAPIASG